MDRVKFYRGLRVDLTHLDGLQDKVEDALGMASSATLLRRDSPTLPGAMSGALSGFVQTYYPISLTVVLGAGIAVDDGYGVVWMTANSAHIDVSAFVAGGDPFVIWGHVERTDTDDVNVVIYDPSLGEQIQAKKFTSAAKLFFQALATGAPPPDSTWFPVREVVSWSGGAPTWNRLCGPLRDLTAHSTALDNAKPTTLVGALAALVQAFQAEHYLAGHTQAGEHHGLVADGLSLSLSGFLWQFLLFTGDLTLATASDKKIEISIGGGSGNIPVTIDKTGLKVGSNPGVGLTGEYQYLSEMQQRERIGVARWLSETTSVIVPGWYFSLAEALWRPLGSATERLVVPLRVSRDNRLLSVRVRLKAQITGAATADVQIYRRSGDDATWTAVACNEANPESIAATDPFWAVRTVTAPTAALTNEEYIATVAFGGSYTAASSYACACEQIVGVTKLHALDGGPAT